ncbi:MAG: MFS transporter [Sandaracinaceae bacterium]|nr:MFS transporter [Sandaracinaceae bacterium]
MSREVIRSAAWGLGTTATLAVLILLGSRNLAHFDAALVAYTFSILFATFGLTYRYAMWLSRPPTAMYWRRGWQAFFRRGWRLRNARFWLSRMSLDVVANRFIFKRDRLRGLTHMLIMWGCILAVAITFPLVFGWLHFRPVAGDLSLYEAVVFGFPAFRFPHDSAAAFFLFHGLVWASFLVIAGVMLAVRRRLRDEGAAAVQRFVEDFLPLFLLFAVSLTGLMLTASYTWMKGYGFTFIAILHAATVIATFLWLPFGKFFHIFQRPAQLGVGFYKDVGRSEEKAHCRRCGHAFTSKMHVLDLISVEKELGYRYELEGEAEHYQWICPPCRRASFAMAQGLAWQVHRGGASPPSDQPIPMPIHVNPGVGEGPLGDEDAENFHP